MHKQVKVYTRPLCLFCHQVLDLLAQAKVSFITVEIIDRPEQDQLIALHRAATFPMVLVDGRYIGGYAHILHLHSQGRLRNLAATPELPPDSAARSQEPPSAVSSPPPTRPSQRSLPSLISTMSRLQETLSQSEPKKR